MSRSEKACNAFTDVARTSVGATAVGLSVLQVWSQSEGQEGFNPNLLLSRLTAWHTLAVQLHFPLIYRAAWMAGWREIDWRGNGLIVLTLTAGMQIALHHWPPLGGEPHVVRPSSYLLWWRIKNYENFTKCIIKASGLTTNRQKCIGQL